MFRGQGNTKIGGKQIKIYPTKMVLLGLDFDNTLVSYDKLFHKLALEKELIDEKVPANKMSIREDLRERGKDEFFTLLQGEVYGLRI